MRSPEDDGAVQSDGAEERLRQHLESRLPAEEVEQVLQRIHPDPEGDLPREAGSPAAEDPDADETGIDETGTDESGADEPVPDPSNSDLRADARPAGPRDRDTEESD